MSNRPVRVLGILGCSYCGSTITETVLNTHPRMTSLGEVYHVVEEWHAKHLDEGRWDLRCRDCGDDCEVYPSSEYPLSYADVHRLPFERSQKLLSWVVDASKVPAYFLKAEVTPSADQYRYVVMAKRPEAAAASFKKYGVDGPGHIMQGYLYFYERVLEMFAAGKREYIMLPYDELVANPDHSFRRIIDLLNHGESEGSRLGYTFGTEVEPAHRFFGNTAALQAGTVEIRRSNSWQGVDHGVTDHQLQRMWDVYCRVLALRMTETKGR